jgi:hypothetical protein
MRVAANVIANAGKWGAMLMAVTLFFSSCVKDKFDEPPVDGPFPDITANITIRDLKNLYTGSVVQITDDLIIEGVVVADDRSGNFYKTMVIQDSTAGISIRLDRTNLFTDYPIGRKVYINCKNLYLGAYRNLIQLGGGVDLSDPADPSIQTIASLLIDKFVVKGPVRQTVTPIDVEIEDLFTGYQNMLIRIKDVQFIPADTGVIYANAATKQSLNRTLQNCSGRTVILRTSGYASFAGNLTPSGNGSITAVYQVFGTTNQLYVRDLNDVEFTNARCQVGPIFTENFNSGTAGNTLALPGWFNVAEEGTKLWLFGGTSTDKYASFSPFPNPKETSNIAWLISPEIAMDAKDRNLNFRSYIDFPDASHTPGEAFVTTNYTGNPLTTTWVKLPAVFATGRTWTSSGALDLSAYKGQRIRIAFKYTGSGTDTSRDGTLQIDNVAVE